VALALLLVPRGLPAEAQGPLCREQHHRDGSVTIECSDGGSRGDDGGPVGPSEPLVPYVTTDNVDGLPCIRSGYVRLSRVGDGTLTEEQATVAAAAAVASLIGLGLGPCPDAPVVPFTPELYALAYLRAIELPVPAPRIDPGVMLVGLESFLEVGSPITYDLGEPGTPFGPATFTFSSTVTVDWGDGEVTGPVASAGGPYPDGDLRHVYTRQGSYDVVVTQDWTATWQIGAESGTIDGLQTTGTLAGFPVQEREAVIVG
jgi:hypothetical protein